MLVGHACAWLGLIDVSCYGGGSCGRCAGCEVEPPIWMLRWGRVMLALLRGVGRKGGSLHGLNYYVLGACGRAWEGLLL